MIIFHKAGAERGQLRMISLKKPLKQRQTTRDIMIFPSSIDRYKLCVIGNYKNEKNTFFIKTNLFMDDIYMHHGLINSFLIQVANGIQVLNNNIYRHECLSKPVVLHIDFQKLLL